VCGLAKKICGKKSVCPICLQDYDLELSLIEIPVFDLNLRSLSHHIFCLFFRFAQMNRQVLDLILPKASSSVPFWPKYEADHVSQELRSMFGLNPHFSMTS